MKCFSVCLLAAMSLGLLASAGPASARELMLRPKLEVGVRVGGPSSQHCIRRIPEATFTAFVFLAGNFGTCGNLNTHLSLPALNALFEKDWEGYLPEKFKENKCEGDRPANLYRNGEFYETRDIGTFQDSGAYIRKWKRPIPSAAEEDAPWPEGEYELRLPGFSYNARVFKFDGHTPQSEANPMRRRSSAHH